MEEAIDWAAEIRRASSRLLVPDASAAPTLLAGPEIETILPHRGAARLLDRVCSFDPARGVAVGIYDVRRSRQTLEGHFPGSPIVPGVLLVEAIGQLGIVALSLAGHGSAEDALLTQILGARFVRPVDQLGEVLVVSKVIDDGMIFRVLGQCIILRDVRCSAALAGIQ